MPVIATNIAANAALNYLNTNSSKESSTLSKLASGSNIVKASDDAAGLAIGTQMNASVTVLEQASVNSSQAQSMLQMADGGLSTISDILTRMESLATESASGNVTDDQRTDIGAEFGQLAGELNSVVTTTTYGSNNLLNGGLSSTNFIVGTLSSNTITVTLAALSGYAPDGTNSNFATVSGYTSATVSSSTGAAAAMSSISSAIADITEYRANVGAYESQFTFISSSIETDSQNLTSAKSTIMDADEASQKSNLSSEDVLSQASVAALSQAAKMPQELLSLIQS
jgi:flagellin